MMKMHVDISIAGVSLDELVRMNYDQHLGSWQGLFISVHVDRIPLLVWFEPCFGPLPWQGFFLPVQNGSAIDLGATHRAVISPRSFCHTLELFERRSNPRWSNRFDWIKLWRFRALQSCLCSCLEKLLHRAGAGQILPVDE